MKIIRKLNLKKFLMIIKELKIFYITNLLNKINFFYFRHIKNFWKFLSWIRSVYFSLISSHSVFLGVNLAKHLVYALHAVRILDYFIIHIIRMTLYIFIFSNTCTFYKHDLCTFFIYYFALITKNSKMIAI